MEIHEPPLPLQQKCADKLHLDCSEGQGKTIVNKNNRGEDIDPGVHDKNINQDIDYNSIHKPPDLNPAPADTRDEYDEVFHDVKFMETKVKTINSGEERIAQSDDKLTRVNINSEYQEMDLHRRNTKVDICIIKDIKQHVLTSATYHNNSRIHLTIVYAKCTEEQRRELWQVLINMASNIQGSWGAIGDYNFKTSGEEKKVGRSYRPEENLDFIEFLNECDLQEAGFTVTHLSRAYSDHAALQIMPALLLVKISNKTSHIRYFKFFNFRTEYQDYFKTVQEAWEEEIYGNPLYILHQKIKNVCKTLSSRSRRTYGDIYEVPKRLEAEIRSLEDNCVNDNSLENRRELNAKLNYKKQLRDIYMKCSQPSLQSTEKCSRQWCTSQGITDDDNNMLTAIPTIQEIRDSAFDMDKDGVPGPDGLSGYF
ncbi:hypothetical protein RDI58_029128 [Solanum bulbocastanum]|uniref:Uncharacterized protein n=1 Tax=Solanum bulbocastanum TaxID=147425 RepID=A0AAN8XZN0_SOLBU